VDVVLRLWDSWEAPAFVKRPDGTLGIDRTYIRAIEHVGKHYKVRGPLQTPRSPQTRPILFLAGASEDGKAFAARIADGIFCVALVIAVAKTYYADMKKRIADSGRDPSNVHILPGLYLFLGSTEAEAKALLEAQSTTDLALKQLAVRLNTSVDKLKLDERVANDILDSAARNPRSHGHSLSMIELFRREQLTVREFLTRQPVSGPHRVVCGSPEQIADFLETWFVEGAADGFNIGNLSHAGLDIFVDHVIPILQKRGLYRHEYEGSTLRSNFVGT
jgi:alkanesulfonate monooxygenase SsuD/methylene tetrahydromethanopterin reductase-like flavin-dependent oxidoreductase (luciferase family)